MSLYGFLFVCLSLWIHSLAILELVGHPIPEPGVLRGVSCRQS